MPQSELQGTITFPGVKKKQSTEDIDELWEFLNHSINLKEFGRSSFDKHIIRLPSKTCSFHISPTNGTEIRFSVFGAQAAITKANKHGELIFGFLNTLHQTEFKHMHVVGAFSTDDRSIMPTKGASLIDRTKLVRIGNKMKVAMKPVGQMIEFERNDEDWLIITADIARIPMLALFFHMTREGVIPSDLIHSMFQNCFQIGKEIKTALSAF